MSWFKAMGGCLPPGTSMCAPSLCSGPWFSTQEAWAVPLYQLSAPPWLLPKGKAAWGDWPECEASIPSQHLLHPTGSQWAQKQ